MPTAKSMALKRQVVSKLEEIFPDVMPLRGKFTILSVSGKKVYLRVITPKQRPKFWFDVKPDLYEQRKAEFLLYACGSTENIYVFPVHDFAKLIAGASVGRSSGVPNFTILLDSHEFEPAGQSQNRHDISQYHNNFALVLLGSEHEIIQNSSLSSELYPGDDLNSPDIAETTLEEQRRIRCHQRAERNQQLARAAKRVHGYSCQICGFNFEEIYGELGKNYIEAHHLTPLAELPPNQTVRLSPIDDFAVVCSNCHRMIHRKGESLRMEELKAVLQKA